MRWHMVIDNKTHSSPIYAPAGTYRSIGYSATVCECVQNCYYDLTCLRAALKFRGIRINYRCWCGRASLPWRIISISIFASILTTTGQSSQANLPAVPLSMHLLIVYGHCFFFRCFCSLSVSVRVFVHSRILIVKIVFNLLSLNMQCDPTEMTLNDIIMLKRRNCKRCELFFFIWCLCVSFFIFCILNALAHSHMSIRLSDRMQIDQIFQVKCWTVH